MDERLAACQEQLNIINDDKNFLDNVITGEESWCFAYDSETKRQSSEWFGKHFPPPKNLRFQKLRVKKMMLEVLTAKTFCTKSSCKKITLLIQNIIKLR